MRLDGLADPRDGSIRDGHHRAQAAQDREDRVDATEVVEHQEGDRDHRRASRRNFSATSRMLCRIAFGVPVEPDEKRITPGSPEAWKSRSIGYRRARSGRVGTTARRPRNRRSTAPPTGRRWSRCRGRTPVVTGTATFALSKSANRSADEIGGVVAEDHDHVAATHPLALQPFAEPARGGDQLAVADRAPAIDQGDRRRAPSRTARRGSPRSQDDDECRDFRHGDRWAAARPADAQKSCSTVKPGLFELGPDVVDRPVQVDVIRVGGIQRGPDERLPAGSQHRSQRAQERDRVLEVFDHLDADEPIDRGHAGPATMSRNSTLIAVADPECAGMPLRECLRRGADVDADTRGPGTPMSARREYMPVPTPTS